jgi:type IV secretion system protein VirB4
MLPNKNAKSPQLAKIYEDMGFNTREIEMISTARPQRDVYYRAEMLGKRLLSVQLSDVELAMLARNDEEDHREMDRILREYPREDFARHWLDAQGHPGALDEEIVHAAD